MSEISDTYACDRCTYVQSSNAEKCEMCDTPNPNRSKLRKENDDKVIKCPTCTFDNTGDFIT
ncbi:unnamed protein product, partial [Adineta steineri]